MDRNALDILVVSNLWPPTFIGGYELGARDIVDRLAARGHRVTVLTSTYGVGRPERQGRVHRLLYEKVRWQPMGRRDMLREALRSRRDLPRVRRLLRTAAFDVVYLFSPLGLNAALLQEVADAGRPVVAYVSDNWVAMWPYTDRLFAKWLDPRPYLSTAGKLALVLARRALRRAGVLSREPWRLPFRHAQFVSRYIREISASRGPFATEEVIPWGIDVRRFRFRERRQEELAEWVYAGQIEEHKGVHTVIDAVRLLRGQGQPVRLTLHGVDTTGFARALKERVEREGLGAWVRFAGPCDRDRLAEAAYERAGLFVFPTMWEEPFSIGLLEAFAAGLPVLGTLTGGTGEILRHGETGTVFSAGSAQHLAAQYYRLVGHPGRAQAMARRAREIVERHLDLDRMVDRLETHLVEVVEGRGSYQAEAWVPRPHAWEGPGAALRAPRAVVPDPEDGRWLAALWEDLALERGEAVAEAEPDSEPSQLFPIAFPDSQVLNGRFGHYLRGLVLNAGAGTTPVAAGTRQVRLDLQLVNRPDVCADLHRLPFRDETFDSVISIAVLEHCRRPWVAMRELRRVLRTGGHLLVAVPFMQPAHANPSDYFRFTEHGLAELAVDGGLTVVDSGPDNSAQHTVGWFLWELLRHHGRHRYLASDPRVNEWFTNFTRRQGRVVVPTLGNGFCLVARRDA